MNRTPQRLAALFLPSLFALGCNRAVEVGARPDAGIHVTDPRPTKAPLSEWRGHFPQVIDREVDLLFLVDNSDSMGDEQASLAANFPRLVEALRSPELGNDLPDLRIGVVSSDLGAGAYGLPSCETPGGHGGKLLSAPRLPGCTAPKDHFLAYERGATNLPVPADDPVEQVKAAFSCIATLGTGGCGFEQSLEAVRRALDPALNVNPGFLRKDALLAVVFLTDEDDCSSKDARLYDPAQQGISDPLGPLNSFRCFEFGFRCDVNDRLKAGPRQNCVPDRTWLYPVEEYVELFKRLKPAGRVVLAAISGPPDRVEVGRDGSEPMLRPSCAVSKSAAAAPALRLSAVLEGDPTLRMDSTFHSICDQDFGPALSRLGRKLVGKLSRQCVAAPLLSASGSLLCAAGDPIGSASDGRAVTCAASCLEKAECTVEEVLAPGTPSAKATPIPRCPAPLFKDPAATCGASCPCWRLVTSADPAKRCDPAVDGSPYRLEVVRSAAPVPGAAVQARCTATRYRWGSRDLADLTQCD
ncbi:MAG: hypothetical protein IT371_08175 [Deltaproteobacteria bacterium]|nr:hypothetical protein [Deltaproteobacteria bacterium]